MYHESTPDLPGYYFIANQPGHEDGWSIAYWDCEAEFPRLYVWLWDLAKIGMSGTSIWLPGDESDLPHKWRDAATSGTWCGPEVWFGPIRVPGGPFGDTTVIPEYEMWRLAKDEGKPLKVSHIDNTSQDRRLGTVTNVRLLDDEPIKRTSN